MKKIGVYIKSKFQSYCIWFIIVVICFFLSVLSDTFLTISNITNIARQVSINVILASGMTLVIILGGIDLSVGASLVLSSLIMADLIKSIGLIPAVIVGLAVGAAIGLVNGLVISRRRSMAFAITLGTMTVWHSVSTIYSGGLPSPIYNTSLENIATSSFLHIPIPFWIAVFVILLCKFILEYTKYGKKIYAIGSNAIAARNCGVSVNIIITTTYMICGVLAALAGIVMTSRLGAAELHTGLNFEMDAIAAVVIGGTSLSGGRGSILGTLAGALIMGLLRNGLNLLYISSDWQQVVIGIFIIVAILWDRDSRS